MIENQTPLVPNPEEGGVPPEAEQPTDRFEKVNSLIQELILLFPVPALLFMGAINLASAYNIVKNGSGEIQGNFGPAQINSPEGGVVIGLLSIALIIFTLDFLNDPRPYLKPYDNSIPAYERLERRGPLIDKIPSLAGTISAVVFNGFKDNTTSSNGSW